MSMNKQAACDTQAEFKRDISDFSDVLMAE